MLKIIRKNIQPSEYPPNAINDTPKAIEAIFKDFIRSRFKRLFSVLTEPLETDRGRITR